MKHGQPCAKASQLIHAVRGYRSNRLYRRHTYFSLRTPFVKAQHI